MEGKRSDGFSVLVSVSLLGLEGAPSELKQQKCVNKTKLKEDQMFSSAVSI